MKTSHGWLVAIAVLLLGNCNSSYGEDSKQENLEVLDVPAFGRVAQLGEFYDATEEQFLNQLIFGKRIPANLDLITSLDNPSTETKFQVVESMSQKITFLGIAASLAVSLKCASFNVDVSGSASFVKDEKQSAKHVQGFLVHNTQTSRDSVDLFYEGIRPYVDLESLSETTASHVVTAIYYGADVAARFTDTNVLNQDLQDIKGKLEISFSLGELLKIEAMAEVNITNGDFSNSSTYDLQVSGDIPMDFIPTNSFEVMEFIKTVPTLLKNINGGKGKPVRYVLTPVKLLEDAYAMEIKNAKIVNTIDEAILQNILFAFDDIGKTRQKLNDLQELFENYMYRCLTPSIKKSLDILSNNFDLRAGAFTVEVRESLVKARGNATALGELQDVLNNYRNHQDYPSNVNLRLEHDFEDGKRKIQFYESFRQHDVLYLTESDYASSLMNTNTSVVYVFFYNLTLVDADVSAWEDGTHIFFGQLKQSGTQLKVVDCDFPLGSNSHCRNLGKSQIHSFIKNKRVSSDVLSHFFAYKRSEPILLPAFSQSSLTTPEPTYELGQMFNRQSTNFLQSFIINKAQNSSDVDTREDTSLCKMQCEIISPNYKSMFLALNIHPMFQVPILLKNLTLQGSGQILSYSQEPTVDRLNLVCERRSGTLSIDVNDVKKLDLVSLIEKTEATHFIQRTEYSGTTVISMETKKSPESMNQLLNKLSSIKATLDPDTDLDTYLDTDLKGFHVTIYSDVLPKSQIHSTNWTETMKVLKVIEDAFENDETQGIKLYHLYPIANVQLDHGIISERKMDPPMTYPGLLNFAEYFDRLASLKFKIENETSFLKEYYDCTPEAYRDIIEHLQQEFDDRVLFWTKNLEVIYPDFYMDGDSHKLGASLEDMEKIIVEGGTTLEILTGTTERLAESRSFYKATEKSSYKYITSESQWREAFYEALTKRAYFLYYQIEWMDSFQDIWVENLSTFFLRFKFESLKSFIVDCSFFPSSFVCANVNQPTIHEYKDGLLTSSDMVKKLKQEAGGDETRQKLIREKLREHKEQEDEKFRTVNSNITDVTATFHNNIKIPITELVEDLRKNISESPRGLPPVQYLYVQYGTEKLPRDLWPDTNWQDESLRYPGKQGKYWKRK